MKLLVRLIINVLTLLIVAYIVPGFEIADIWTATVAAVVIGLVNTFLRPLLLLITLPITLVTFGVFAFVINILLLMLSAIIVPGFQIDGFFTAAVSSVVLSLVSWFLHRLATE